MIVKRRFRHPLYYDGLLRIGHRVFFGQSHMQAGLLLVVIMMPCVQTGGGLVDLTTMCSDRRVYCG